MNDDLSNYYSRELQFIRRTAGEFAQANGKIAERLRVGTDGECADPHVERLIEAFALLSARIRRKIDDEFPEFCTALLDILYPHYLAPIPSMCIAQLDPESPVAAMTSGYQVRRHTLIQTAAGPEGACTFRTAYPVTVNPIELIDANLAGLSLGSSHPRDGSVASLRLDLQALAPDKKLAELEIPSLRFFISGPMASVQPLYELLFTGCTSVSIRSGRDELRTLPRTSLAPVGFDREEGMLPYPKRSALAYRLLSEFFSFPQKFLFFDVKLPPNAFAGAGRGAELSINLSKSSPELEHFVNRDTFRLHCTPLVNLFPHRCEPMELDHRRMEHPVIADTRRPELYEIWSIDRVVATAHDERQIEIRPFYSLKHAAAADQPPIFYSAQRRNTDGGALGPGSELSVTIVDADPSIPDAQRWTLDVEAMCLNRNVPQHLPFGPDQPQMRLVEGGPVKCVCVTQPTPTARPPMDDAMRWKLVSHLTLNHLSLTGGHDGAEAMRELLQLYEPLNKADNIAQIQSLAHVTSRHAVSRAAGVGPAGLCRGLEVSIEFDEDRLPHRSAYLMASVIDRFLPLYTSINSFTRLHGTSRQRKRETWRWPARAGERVLL